MNHGKLLWTKTLLNVDVRQPLCSMCMYGKELSRREVVKKYQRQASTSEFMLFSHFGIIPFSGLFNTTGATEIIIHAQQSAL